MKKKKLKKSGVAVIAVPILAAGTVAVVSAYQAGVDFKPSGEQKDLQTNQVVFDNNDTVGHDKDKKDDSSLFEKNKDATEQKNNQNQNGADYLFEAGNLPDGVDIASFAGNGNENLFTGDRGNSDMTGGYQMVADASDADVIISNNNASSANGTSNGGNGTSNGNSTSGSNTNGNGSNSGNGDSGNGGSSDDENPGGNTDNPQTPDDNNGGNNSSDSTIADPLPVGGSEKGSPSYLDPDFIGGSYNENVKPRDDAEADGDNQSVIIQQPFSIDAYEGEVLYKGQQIEKRTLYNALETYVIGEDGKWYVWTTKTDPKTGETIDAMDRYIRIDGVSFDGGSTWNTSFPTTIPMDIQEGNLKIKVSYRLSEKSSTWITRIVDYDVQSGRVIVLNQKVQGDKIDSGNVLNYDQYPASGKKMNLFRYQDEFFTDKDKDSKGYLKYLFPGWTENGKQVSWFYDVTDGRHILEPSEKVALKSGYKVNIKVQWLDENYQEGSNLCYLQTLTGYEKNVLTGMKEGSFLDRFRYTELDVPEYIQAVDMSEDQELAADYVKIPDTVIHIGTCADAVKGYIVDSGNSCFAVNEEGVLTNQKETEILGIPYEVESVTVPEKVTKISLSSKNQIHTLILDADSLEKMPEISYKKLSDCKIVVADELMEQYLKQNYKNLAKGSGNCVASAENPGITYTLKNGAIVSDRGGLRKMLDMVGSSVTLSEDVYSIQENAFSEVPGVTSLILAKNGGLITLEKDCLANSNIDTIRCYTQEQFDSVTEQLKTAGGKEDITVELVQTTKKGFVYGMSKQGEETTATLIQAPKDITEYDGTITDETEEPVEITDIADKAFANCDKLQWVKLPESTKSIGYQAFENCTALEGVMICSEDSITIKNEAFSGCSSLRLMASDAMYGEIDGNYNPFEDSQEDNQEYVFVPTDSEGYNRYCTYFVEGSGVTGYDLVDTGATGKVLYGLNEYDEPWLALRAGKHMDDTVELPATTLEIFGNSMEGTVSPSGCYTVNWQDLNYIDFGEWSYYGPLYIDESAFANSDLGGNIVIEQEGIIASAAFSGCANIQTISFNNYSLRLSDSICTDCTNLSEVYIAGSDLYGDMFRGCDNLRTIRTDDAEPLDCVVYENSELRFNSDWSLEEEQEKLSIIVPDGREENYLKKWRYSFAGYEGYSAVKDAVRTAYIKKYQEIPTDDWVDENATEKVLASENRIRALLGMEQTETPTNLYPCKTEEGDFGLVLTEVSAGVTEIDLMNDDLGLSKYDNIAYIGENAFAKCPDLTMVHAGYWLSGIYSNAFAGVTSGSLTLDLSDEWGPIQLMGYTPEHPFTFGADEDTIHIQISPFMWDGESDYINAWMFPFAGYSYLDEMREGVKAELSESDSTVTDLEVDAEIAERLFKIENRLRKMLGVEEITDVSEITCKDLKCYSKEEALQKKQEEQQKNDSEVSDSETDGSDKKDDAGISDSESYEADKKDDAVVSENQADTQSEKNKKNEGTPNGGEEIKK